MIGEIENRYYHQALIKRVLESQRRRRFLKNIMRDQSISWDYQHVENSGDAYIRNTMPIYQLEKKSRFPQGVSLLKIQKRSRFILKQIGEIPGFLHPHPRPDLVR